MLMLMLDNDRTFKYSRNKHGEMVLLSEYTCDFILGYCLKCMSPAEARLALTPRTFRFLEEDYEEKEVIKEGCSVD